MDKTRELAIQIIELFEELLERYKIDIPSEDRDCELASMNETEKKEAGLSHIYGTDYYDLEDSIVELLNNQLSGGSVPDNTTENEGIK